MSVVHDVRVCVQSNGAGCNFFSSSSSFTPLFPAMAAYIAEAPPISQDDFEDMDLFERLDDSIAEMEKKTVFCLV